MGPKWEQRADRSGRVGRNWGLIFIPRAEALKQVVGVEVKGWECHDLIYDWKNGELIGRH